MCIRISLSWIWANLYCWEAKVDCITSLGSDNSDKFFKCTPSWSSSQDGSVGNEVGYFLL